MNQSGCDALVTFSQGKQSYTYIKLAVILSDWRAESWAAGTSGGVCTELDTAVGAWTEEGAGKGGVRGWVSTHHGEDQTTKEGGVLELGFLEDSFPCISSLSFWRLLFLLASTIIYTCMTQIPRPVATEVQSHTEESSPPSPLSPTCPLRKQHLVPS